MAVKDNFVGTGWLSPSTTWDVIWGLNAGSQIWQQTPLLTGPLASSSLTLKSRFLISSTLMLPCPEAFPQPSSYVFLKSSLTPEANMTPCTAAFQRPLPLGMSPRSTSKALGKRRPAHPGGKTHCTPSSTPSRRSHSSVPHHKAGCGTKDTCLRHCDRQPLLSLPTRSSCHKPKVL